MIFLSVKQPQQPVHIHYFRVMMCRIKAAVLNLVESTVVPQCLCVAHWLTVMACRAVCCPLKAEVL